MDTKIINAENAPAAVGPYCHAVEAGDFVFTSGQIGLDPQTQELKEGVAAQTKQVLANLGAVLKASDLTLDNVIKTTVFLADINDFAEINEIYEEAFGDNKPARSCVQAVSLTTKFDNFMILRGTSKFFCAPGLRLGYGICGNLAFLERMNSIKNPWTINTLAALAGEAMFMDTDYIQTTKDYIQSERTRCIDILSKRDNLKIYPAYANFILVKLLDGTTSFEMFERCIKSGLMIRDCASFHGLDGEFIRFCIQKKEDNDRLLNLLTL